MCEADGCADPFDVCAREEPARGVVQYVATRDELRELFAKHEHGRWCVDADVDAGRAAIRVDEA